jgi:hypothetical protein
MPHPVLSAGIGAAASWLPHCGQQRPSSPPINKWTIIAPSTAVLTKLLDIVNKKVSERKSTIDKEFGSAFLPKVLANHFIM